MMNQLKSVQEDLESIQQSKRYAENNTLNDIKKDDWEKV